MRWAGYVARTGKKRNACRILVRKPEGKTRAQKLRRRWEDNIKVGCGGIGWIDPAQDRDQYRTLVNTVMNLRVPQMLVISRVPERMAASQAGLCFLELVRDKGRAITQAVSRWLPIAAGRVRSRSAMIKGKLNVAFDDGIFVRRRWTVEFAACGEKS
jgi:hypothetical protein